MKRKHKLYSKPKRPFDKTRIHGESEIIKRFGLKNKKEIWKAEAKIDSIRQKAKNLITADLKEQESFFGRLKKMGLNVNSIAEVLSLTKEDYLKRRLQSVIVEKKIVSTMKSARQLITHRKVIVGENVVDSPSYIVPVDLEDKILLRTKTKKQEKDKNIKNEENKEAKEEIDKSESESKETKVNKEETEEKE